MVTFLNDVLAPFGEVVDREIVEGFENFKIATLIATTLHTFEQDVEVEFEEAKKTKLAFEFYRPFT